MIHTEERKFEGLSTLIIDNQISSDGTYFRANESLAVGKPFLAKRFSPHPFQKFFSASYGCYGFFSY